jgi:hypothetical protein
MTTNGQFELQLFDLEEDYKTLGRFDNQADAEAAISTIPDSLLRDYSGIRVVDWSKEEVVVEYLIPGSFQIVQ